MVDDRPLPIKIPESHRHCPVGHATALLGDRWSMMIVREALGGASRYQEFKDALGISDHTLTRRLAHLQGIGVLERNDERSGRYLLTDAGEDLARVMAVLGDWAMQWLPVERPLRPPVEPVVEAAEQLGFETRARLRNEEDTELASAQLTPPEEPA